MPDAPRTHLARLRKVCTAFCASTLLLAAVAATFQPPSGPHLNQAETLFWILVFLTVVNLVTMMPAYRSTLAGPRRVFPLSQRPGPLLRAHFVAHIVAFARLEVIAVAGFVLFFLSGRLDWFLLLDAVAAIGMLILWPRKRKVDALLVTDQNPA